MTMGIKYFMCKIEHTCTQNGTAKDIGYGRLFFDAHIPGESYFYCSKCKLHLSRGIGFTELNQKKGKEFWE